MRKFRTSRENLRDIRIAYTFLLSAAFIAVLLGIITERYSEKLRSREISSLRATLTLCADSLSDWTADGDYESRCTAAAHFSAAMASLPPPTDMEALAEIKEGMVTGEVSKEAVKTFSDTFFLLSELDYESPAEAKRIAAETLNSVCEALCHHTESVTNTSVLPEVIKYSKKIAQDTIDKLFDANNTNFELAVSEENLIAEADNLRMEFSKEDGSLEEFIYIRLNGKRGEVLDIDGQINSALSFFSTVVRQKNLPDVGDVTEVCGFLTVNLKSQEESWKVTVDERGNVWSFSKSSENS